MVEFAIAAGIFVTLLLGIVEFALASWQKNSVAADAREGARYASLHGARSSHVATSDSVSNYVKSITSLGGNSIRVTTVWPDNPPKDPGSRVEVSVAHSVPRRGIFLSAHVDSATSKLIIMN